MTPLSVVMPYYRNPRMLARHYRIWSQEWPAALKDQVEIVIVDDGSPEPALDVERPDGLPALSIYRILEDRPWHQHAARNLGAHVAAHPFLLMTDHDHVIPADTLAEVLAAKDRGRVFTFGRVDAPLEPWRSDHASTMERTKRANGSLKPHVNSFAIARKLYWEIGGYDEDYCGVYGTDGVFRKRLYKAAPECHLVHAPLIRVSRDVIPDASTRDVARKEGRDLGTKQRIADEKRARGAARKITVLNFPWEQVHGPDFHNRPIRT